MCVCVCVCVCGCVCVCACVHVCVCDDALAHLLVILGDIDGVDFLVGGHHEEGSLTNLTETKTWSNKNNYLKTCFKNKVTN